MSPYRAVCCGYSLVEMLVVIGVVSLTLMVAVPGLGHAVDVADAAAAARYLAAIVAQARIDAVRRQAAVALRFGAGEDAAFSLVVDGDRDGVSAADVAAGIDQTVRPPDRISWHFGRARLGVGRTAPGIEGGPILTAGTDPVQLGAARQLTLTPLGTATSGTIYITSRGGALMAVRVGGVTGRARVMRLSAAGDRWVPQ